MTLLAQLIAHQEGFGPPGNLPTKDNNPGDLRHSPHSSHVGEDPNDIGKIDTVADGWADLERQLQIYAREGLTLAQMVRKYTDVRVDSPSIYLQNICEWGDWNPTTLVSVALQKIV